MNDAKHDVRLITRDELMDKAEEVKQVATDKAYEQSAQIASRGRYSLPPNAKQLLGDAFAYIPKQFEQFLDGNPEQVSAMVEILERAKLKLSDQARFNLQSVGAKLVEWDGEAADHFRDAFAFPFLGIAANQGSLAAVAIAGLRNYEQILTRMRFDAHDAAQGTINALNAEANGSDAQLALTGAAVSVIGAAVSFASGGAFTPVVFAMLTGVASTAGPINKYLAAGSDSASILKSLNSRLQRIRAEKDAECARLAGRLGGDLTVSFEETVVGSKSTRIPKLVAPKPLFIDMDPLKRKAQFYHPDW